MKNWRTTLAGFIVSAPFMIDALIQAYTAGYFTDKTGWQLFASVAFVVFSRLAKDHNVSGTSKGVQSTEEDNSLIGTRPPKKDPNG